MTATGTWRPNWRLSDDKGNYEKNVYNDNLALVIDTFYIIFSASLTYKSYYQAKQIMHTYVLFFKPPE